MYSINTEFGKRQYAMYGTLVAAMHMAQANRRKPMTKLGRISPLAFSRMKQRGISIDTLHHLLAHGQVEKQFDGARVVYLDSPDPGPAWRGHPKPRLYAVVDAAGEVLTVEKRVRLRD
jgi:hypothetical protein